MLRAFLVAFLVLSSAAALSVADLGAASGPAPLVGAQRNTPWLSFEPTVGVDSAGNVYLTGESYTGSVQQRLIYKSENDGRNWTDITMKIGGRVSYSPVNNDPYLYVDDTDRIFNAPNQALLCTAMSYSDDGGATWNPSALGCGHPVGGHDHQTLWSGKPRTVTTDGYPNVLYYCVNRVADTACATSLDGGVTFGAFKPVVFAPYTEPTGMNLPFPPVRVVCGPNAGGLTGHGTSAPDGTAYLGASRCGMPAVAYSRDDGATWTTSFVSRTAGISGHDVELAVDSAGNVYAAWIGLDLLPRIAVSTDGATTWSNPRTLAPATVGTTDFVAIAAGDPGRVAVTYYGTAAAKPYAQMNAADVWHAYLTVSYDMLAAAPTFETVTMNDPADPIARAVCDSGSRCNGVGDFLDVVIDREGRPWAALVDVCHTACIAGAANAGAKGGVGTLASGPRLRGDGDLPPLR